MKDDLAASIFSSAPFALCGFYILIVVMGYRYCKYLEEKYKWVKRHWSFLDALSRDIKEVKDSVEETKKRASEFGDSALNLEGITQPLQEIEMQWVSKAGNVVFEAGRCVQYFENLMAISTFFNSYLFVIFNLMSIVDLALGMRRTTDEINKHLKEQKELTNKLCGLLEQSRNKLRRLQDRPIGNLEKKPLSSKVFFSPTLALALEPLTSIQDQNLIHGKLAEQLRLTVIKVKLLQAFVKDLRWFKLESEIEKAWMKEAEDFIDEADEAINTNSEQEAKIVRWPVAFGLRHWMAKRKLKKSISHFDSRYCDLLEAKDRYGLRFIRRVSSENVRQRLQHRDDGVISTALDSIWKQVPKSTAEYSQGPHHRISLLCKQMEDIRQLLKDEKATEGARTARTACFHLLKKVASEASKCVKNYMEASPSKLQSEIERIHNAADLLYKTVQVCSIEVIEDSCSVVGLEEDIHKLVSKISNPTKDEGGHLPIISIVGTKGIGKTTLAKEIYNHRSIVDHFKVCRFVTLPQGDWYSDETVLLKNVRNQILLQTWGKGSGKEGFIAEIRDFLKKQACLLVLDDIRSTKAWDVLKQALPDESRSVILLTTCCRKVASHANPSNDTSNIHYLRLRTGEESWEFFTQMFHSSSDDNKKIRSLAKKVVARTGGLPLAILRLGFLFSGNCLAEEELSRMLEGGYGSQGPWSETWEINKEGFQSDPILDKCFSYSEFFPRDFKIPSRRLVALWVASGLFGKEDIVNNRSKQEVQGSGDSQAEKTREKLAYRYLQELIDRNMIQVVERKRNGNVKTCRFPNTLEEIWLHNTRKNVTRARSWSLFSSFDGQLAYRFDDKDASSGRSVHGLNSDIVFPEEKYPRSIMFFDTREGNEPGEDIGKFLLKGISSRRFEDLLVLDLEGVFRPHLPKEIGNLKKLTYLGLRSTYLEILPEFIGSLLQLQTLDLKHTYVRELPSSSWKLKRLKNLYLNRSCRIKMPHRGASSAKNLQRLCGVFVDQEGSDLANNLVKFQSLGKLGITIFRLHVEQQKGLVKAIAELSNLRSLSLRSINEKGEPQDLKLKSFKKLEKLSSLYLLGKLEKSIVISDLPKSLIELTLSASGLLEDPMPKLGKLPYLKFLSFLSDSYQGTSMVCSKQDFPELVVLHVWNLPNLEKLDVEVGAMQKLREFEVRSCQNLRYTTGLTNLKVLHVLTLKDMPEDNAIENEFAAAKENSPDTTIIHCPKINRNKTESGPNPSNKCETGPMEV